MTDDPWSELKRVIQAEFTRLVAMPVLAYPAKPFWIFIAKFACLIATVEVVAALIPILV